MVRVTKADLEKVKIEKLIVRAIKKLCKDKTALREMRLCMTGIAKLSTEEITAFLNHIKRTEKNSVWLFRCKVLEIAQRILINEGICTDIYEIEIEGKTYGVKDAKVMLNKIHEFKEKIKGLK